MRAACILFFSTLATDAADQSRPLRNSNQCLVVITSSWTASSGILRSFERTDRGKWEQRRPSTPVLVGRAGLGWGRGEIGVTDLPGPVKHEGDDKAPAGLFRLGTAFGYAPNPFRMKQSYLSLSRNVVAVDDPRSRYYNRIVDKMKTPDADWRSAENMILPDNRYKWGIVVRHNVPPVPGAGSCIFLHVWKDASTATSGCTAMPEPAMIDLLKWLDPAKRPLLIQLPRSIYSELHQRWRLPELND